MTYSGMVIVDHPDGLHARPAAKFVQMAAGFPCKIMVKKAYSEKSKVANAKSPLSILTLGIKPGEAIEILAEGDRAKEAVDSLIELVKNRFNE